jgi:S-adenosylmethionine:tRNA ribosyltransferase-isomerase
MGMDTDLFDFDLPPERIALRPAAPRDAARLLVVRPGSTPELQDRGVRDLPDLLCAGDALVVNDTRVIPARLCGRRIGRGAMEPAIEATLHRRLDGARWRAFVKPAKRLSPGDVVRFGEEGEVCFLGQLDATVEEKSEGGETGPTTRRCSRKSTVRLRRPRQACISPMPCTGVCCSTESRSTR